MRGKKLWRQSLKSFFPLDAGYINVLLYKGSFTDWTANGGQVWLWPVYDLTLWEDTMPFFLSFTILVLGAKLPLQINLALCLSVRVYVCPIKQLSAYGWLLGAPFFLIISWIFSSDFAIFLVFCFRSWKIERVSKIFLCARIIH